MANHTIKKIIQKLLEDDATQLDDETKCIIDKILQMSNKDIWDLIYSISVDFLFELKKILPNLLSTDAEECINILKDPDSDEEEQERALDVVNALACVYLDPICERIATKYSVTIQTLHLLVKIGCKNIL